MGGLKCVCMYWDWKSTLNEEKKLQQQQHCHALDCK